MAIKDIIWISGELHKQYEGSNDWEEIAELDSEPRPKPTIPPVGSMFDETLYKIVDHLLEQYRAANTLRIGTLGIAQEVFSICFGALILKANEGPYGVRLGDVFRDPRAHGERGEQGPYGFSISNHKLKLAGDLNLMNLKTYLPQTASHRPLGLWWEELGQHFGIPLRWGGRFNDGNHYELERSWTWEPLE